MAKPKNRLEYLRKTNFLSQQEVAETLGMSQQFYNKIENGKARLTIEIAIKLKGLYNCVCIDNLLDDCPQNEAV